MKLKPSKCEIGFQSLDFQGHRIIEDSRTPYPSNLNKVLEAARPQTKKHVMSLMGLFNFYRSYIPMYSEIALPLTDLLKRSLPNKITWEDKHEVAFQKLKSCLLSAPILKMPDLGRSFVLQTDACDRCIGAALLQYDDDNVLHPISFCSKKLSPRESVWSISERECLAVVYAIQKYRKYLYGETFELQTDHQALSILKTSETSSPRLQRWALTLQPYRFRVKYIPARDNIFGDFFSRHFNA